MTLSAAPPAATTHTPAILRLAQMKAAASP